MLTFSFAVFISTRVLANMVYAFVMGVMALSVKLSRSIAILPDCRVPFSIAMIRSACIFLPGFDLYVEYLCIAGFNNAVRGDEGASDSKDVEKMGILVFIFSS